MPIPDNDPIVVAPTPTPFRDDDGVDHVALTRNVERWLDTPLSGFVLGTANGEELSLSEHEKEEIIRTVAHAHGGQSFIIAGIDNPSVAETLRLSERYAEAGADLIRVRVPRSQSSESIEKYFGQVTEFSPKPVIVIHQTFSDSPAAPPEVIGAMCRLDNVFGYITDHDVRFEAWVRPHIPEEKKFWICNGGLLAFGTLMGANGACMWLGNIAPKLCMDIISLGYHEKFTEARDLQVIASKLDRTIGQFGVAGVKAALGLLGYEGISPRSPTPSVTDAQLEEISSVLVEAGLL